MKKIFSVRIEEEIYNTIINIKNKVPGCTIQELSEKAFLLLIEKYDEEEKTNVAKAKKVKI